MSQRPLTVGDLREHLSALPDDAELAVTAGDGTYVLVRTIVALCDNAAILQCAPLPPLQTQSTTTAP